MEVCSSVACVRRALNPNAVFPLRRGGGGEGGQRNTNVCQLEERVDLLHCALVSCDISVAQGAKSISFIPKRKTKSRFLFLAPSRSCLLPQTKMKNCLIVLLGPCPFWLTVCNPCFQGSGCWSTSAQCYIVQTTVNNTGNTNTSKTLPQRTSIMSIKHFSLFLLRM